MKCAHGKLVIKSVWTKVGRAWLSSHLATFELHRSLNAHLFTLKVMPTIVCLGKVFPHQSNVYFFTKFIQVFAYVVPRKKTDILRWSDKGFNFFLTVKYSRASLDLPRNAASSGGHLHFLHGSTLSLFMALLGCGHVLRIYEGPLKPPFAHTHTRAFTHHMKIPGPPSTTPSIRGSTVNHCQLEKILLTGVARIVPKMLPWVGFDQTQLYSVPMRCVSANNPQRNLDPQIKGGRSVGISCDRCRCSLP